MYSGIYHRAASLLFLLIVGLASAVGQFPQLRFEHITTANGLPNSSIYSILMDRQGFLWFGTNEGIVRYDGRRFTRIAPARDGSLFQGQSIVYDFIESRDGTIWCATPGGGVLRYNPANDTLTRLTSSTHGLSNNFVYAVCEDAKGTLWVGSSGGLDTLDFRSGHFCHVVRMTAKEQRPVDVKITALSEWPRGSGVLWIGTWGQGLLRFDRNGGQWSGWRERPIDPHGLYDGRVRTIFMPRERSQELWVGTEGDGFYRLDIAGGAWRRFRLSPQSQAGSIPLSIKHINESASGTLLVSTLGGGFYLVDPASGRSQQFIAGSRRIASISHDDVRMSWVDPNGTIWVGTRNGIDRADPVRGLFSTVSHNPDDRHGGLTNNMAAGICEDRHGVLWVGTAGGGLNRFDRKRGHWHAYVHDPRRAGSLATNDIGAVYEDQSGSLWVGGMGGWLHRFQRSTGTFERWQIARKPFDVSTTDIYCISQDRKGTLWLGTTIGLMKFEPRTGTATLIATDGLPPDRSHTSYVYAILEDRSGGFWIAAGHGGVHRVDRATGRYETFAHVDDDPGSLSGSSATSLLEDRRGTLWIGTAGGGINRFSPSRNRFESFTKTQGLSDNSVTGILEDIRGRIWISTARGLTVYEPKTGEWSSFDTNDGLPSGEFALCSAERCADGTLCFGSVSGVTIFRPDSLFENTHVPPIVLTALERDGQEFVNERAASHLQTVIFPSPNHVYSFEVAALDYRRPERNRYAYQLEGVDNGWVQAGTRHLVAYSNLSPGTYVFRARGTNDSGLWSTEELAITVVIEPLWWQALWFRILALLITLGLLIVVFQALVSHLRKEKIAQQRFSQKLIESQEAERKHLAAELHDGLGQDLLVAKNELQQFLDCPGGSKDDLRNVVGIVQDAIEGVREISSNLHPHLIDRLGFCAAVEAMTEVIEHSTGLIIDCTCDDVDHLLPKEKEINVYRIIQEALSNVVRHARATKVGVEVKKLPRLIRVTIIDNGQGFDQETVSMEFSSEAPGEGLHGLGLSSMSERARISGGTLSIASSPGSGTKVDLTVPYYSRRDLYAAVRARYYRR